MQGGELPHHAGSEIGLGEPRGALVTADLALQGLIVVLGLILVISLPSMVIAWLKLRQRTLGPILEGNGWAVNGRVAINIPFGTSLTGMVSSRRTKACHWLFSQT